MWGNFRRISAVCTACALDLLSVIVAAYAYIDRDAARLVSQILTPLLVAAAAAALPRRQRRLANA